MNDLTITSQDAAVAMRSLMAGGIEHAERTMLAHEQADCPVVHHFGPGIYIREVHLKAGLFAIGHRQKFEHVNVMLKGRVLMLQNDGSTVEVVAPTMFVGKPGRKMGYVLEDVVWQNIYATEVRDVSTLEDMFLDKSLDWHEVAKIKTAAAHAAHEADRVDFQAVLHESGFSAETVREQSENPLDQVPMPMGSWKIKVGRSSIQGVGVFLTADVTEGEVLGPARVNGMRTPLGRYTNHSPIPNARMELLPNGDVQLVAARGISGCHGGEDGEEVTIDYRQALRLSGIICKGAST